LHAVRVAVTGLGVISSIATGFDDFSEAILRGSSRQGPVTAIETAGLNDPVASEVREFEDQWGPHPPIVAGRAAQFAVAAARMAVNDAFGGWSELSDRPSAVVLGTSDGGSHELDQLVATYHHGGEEQLDPDLVRQVPADRIGRTVVNELGLRRAETLVNGAGCAASNQAIGLAADAVVSGEADFAITGGADALCRRGFAAFSRLNLMSPDLCRPFDVDRKGLILGEGAAVLVLEDMDRAHDRGAHVYAEILGYAANCDRHHPVHPVADSLASCMQVALDRAGVRPEEVDMISAHGSGTPTNDVVEAQALTKVYGSPPPVTAVKSMLGHTMGAAGAMGALACITAIQAQEIPPILNHRNTDPACNVECVANRSRSAAVNIAQNNALGFFGNNAVVLFKRPNQKD
jgi:3-oxoacyl-[acyl-carrier-protein] synthase II